MHQILPIGEDMDRECSGESQSRHSGAGKIEDMVARGEDHVWVPVAEDVEN